MKKKQQKNTTTTKGRGETWKSQLFLVVQVLSNEIINKIIIPTVRHHSLISYALALNDFSMYPLLS